MRYLVTDYYRTGSHLQYYYHWELDVVQHVIRSLADPNIARCEQEKLDPNQQTRITPAE